MFALAVVLGLVLPSNVSASNEHRIVGSWVCLSRGIPKAENTPQYDSFRKDGVVRWRTSSRNGPLSAAYSYKFDGKVLTIYGPGLPGVLKWNVRFTSPNAFNMTPITGEILAGSCQRDVAQQ